MRYTIDYSVPGKNIDHLVVMKNKKNFKLSLPHQLRFGKYKGQLLRDVIESNPNWVVWALDNIDWFEIDSVARRRLNEVYVEPEPDQDEEDAFRADYGADIGDR